MKQDPNWLRLEHTYIPFCRNAERLYMEAYQSSIVPLVGELVEIEFGFSENDATKIFKFFKVEVITGKSLILSDINWKL